MDKMGLVVRSGKMMYEAVVQTVLLYVSDSWVITDATMKVFEGFHHIFARIITEKTDLSVGGEVWEYPPAEEAIYLTGMCPIQLYVRRQQAIIVDYITTCLIFELCNGRSRCWGTVGS